MKMVSRILIAAWLTAAAAGCARRVALDPQAVKEHNSDAWKVTSEPQAIAPAPK